jgi:hypothetical protein
MQQFVRDKSCARIEIDGRIDIGFVGSDAETEERLVYFIYCHEGEESTYDRNDSHAECALNLNNPSSG